MKVVTSMVFEINLPENEIEAYKLLSEQERNQLVEEMKKDMVRIINNECVAEATFREMSVEVKEGE